MKKYIIAAAVALVLCTWANYHVTIQVGISPSGVLEAAFPQVRTGQLADGAITFEKFAAALQTEWAQFRGLVGSGSEMTWTVSAVTQISDPATTLTITHGIQQYEGIGGVTLTSTPTIQAGIDGQLVRIRCVSDTHILTLQSETNLPGSLLILSNGQNFRCGRGDSLLAAYNGLTTRWEEINRIDIQ